MENNITINSPVIPTGNINQGTVAIESSRATAEALGKLMLAKQSPRDVVAAYTRVAQACQRIGVAEKAFYSYQRSGTTVTGVTIRFAEELARCWGNIDFGLKELSRDNGKSEMQAYAWDTETNTISQQTFTVLHVREKNKTTYDLTSERDIYENNTNYGSRRLRSRILAILPSDLVDMAIEECKKTLNNQTNGINNAPLIDYIKNLVIRFENLGVKKEDIEQRANKKVENFDRDDYVEYVGILNSIGTKETKASEWFSSMKPDISATAKDLSNALKGGKA
ncbi:MAG: hypothetical protein ACI4JM_04765 [Oscillospiraceae bacterium]